MFDYRTLDLIADAYNPALAFAALILILIPLAQKQWLSSLLRLLTAISLLSIAYGLMLLDHLLSVWPAIGLDYSTHTAVALMLVMYLYWYAPRLRMIGLGTLMVYILLMLYQGYHTLADILSTAMISGIIGALVFIAPTSAPNRHPKAQEHSYHD